MRNRIARVVVGLCLFLAVRASAATYPPGFTESLVTSSLVQPTHFAIAADGRIFVAEKQGRVRLIKNGVLLSTPVLTVSVHTERYRGIMGIALDRDFTTNGHLYIYYTSLTPTIHNRISRFTVVGDTAASGSELVLFDLPTSQSAAHNGGALAVGTDGRIYAGSGDDNTGSNSQTLSTVRGKILRINTDGSIPVENPFYAQTSGINRAIYAMGVRQPWSIGFDNSTGAMILQDVGATTYEEVNLGRAGANYGHPDTEGPTTDSRFDAPIHSYRIGGTGTTVGCAGIGATFYRPATVMFPTMYLGRYFFADHCNGWMKTLDPSNGNQVSIFATGMTSGDGLGVSDIQVAPDGSLYYVLHNGRLHRITYDASVTPGPTPTPTPTPAVRPTATPTRTPTPVPVCRTLTPGQWMNSGFAGQSATFTYEFDVRPSSATMSALAGLSRGAQTGGSNLLANIRFRTTGYIDMRDGSTYRSASPLRYFAGMQYHVRMVVNLTADTYTVYVKPLGEGEVLLGSNYQLRIAASLVDNFAAGVTSSNGTLEVCGGTLSGTPAPRPTLTPTPTPTPRVVPPTATPTPTPTPVVGVPTPTPTPTPTRTPTPTPTPSGSFVEITPGAAAVVASTNDGNLPGNTVDNNLATRWSGCGDGAWIQYDLGTTHTVSHVRIAFYSGNQRQTQFDIQTSGDGLSWQTIAPGLLSSGTTTQQETFDFTDTPARYVRYLGHGNTLNAWNSVTEVDIYAVP